MYQLRHSHKDNRTISCSDHIDIVYTHHTFLHLTRSDVVNLTSSNLVNLDFDARVPIPFSVFPSSYKNNEAQQTTEIKTDERLTVEGTGRDDKRRTEVHIHEQERRRPDRIIREERVHIHEDDRESHYREPFRRYANAQIDVEDRVIDRNTYPRDYPRREHVDIEEVRVHETKTYKEPDHKHRIDMGYTDDEGHYHSFRRGVEKAADRILHPIHGAEHHHHHHDREQVVIEDREIHVSAPRRESKMSSRRERESSNSITIPSHHIRVGDLLILQGRPCQVIRITTSAQTGQHRYLGVDLFTKQLHEESSFTSNPSPSVYVQNMLGPVFKQYRVLDIRDDGRVVAMTETGDVKQGLRVADQSSLLRRLTDAYDSGRGSIRVLVINDDGRELAVDYRVVHGSRL